MVRERLSGIDRPILKFYAYSATTSVGFYTPVLYVLFRATGLSYTEIALLESIFMLTTIVGEIPTGWLGDRIGWRKSLVVANVLIAGTVVGIGLATSVLQFALLHVTWSLGYNFRSGSEDAWLYEAVAANRDESDFAGIRGKARSLGLVVGTASAAVGGQLASTDLFFPFVAAGLVTLSGVPILLSLPRVRADREESFSYREAVGVVRSLVSTARLRRFVVFLLVVTYLVAASNVFTQPVALDLGLATAHLGILYAIFKLASAGASYAVEDLVEFFGEDRILLLGPLAIGVVFLTIAIAPILALPAFLIARSIKSVVKPIGYQRINGAIESRGRATALSGVAMLGSGFGIAAKFGSGILADATSPFIALVAIGAVVAGMSLFVVAAGSDSIATTAPETEQSETQSA